MLPNHPWDQISDQCFQQERQDLHGAVQFSADAEQREQPTVRRRQKHLLLLDWEPSGQATRTVVTARATSRRRARAGIYDAAVALLLLASLAAIAACFVR